MAIESSMLKNVKSSADRIKIENNEWKKKTLNQKPSENIVKNMILNGRKIVGN